MAPQKGHLATLNAKIHADNFFYLAWRHFNLLKLNWDILFRIHFWAPEKNEVFVKSIIRYTITNTDNLLVFVFVFQPNSIPKQRQTKKKRNETNIRHSLVRGEGLRGAVGVINFKQYIGFVVVNSSFRHFRGWNTLN